MMDYFTQYQHGMYTIDGTVFLYYTKTFGDAEVTCNICKKIIERLYMKFFNAPGYDFLPVTASMCKRCVVNREKSFICTLTDDQLPLLINFVWVSPEGEAYYKKTLQNVEVG